LQGNALISADEVSDASFQRDKGELRMWAVSQPPTLQEILETERLREEYKKCAQALAACNPAAKIEPSKQRKLIYPLIERMVMIGAPADAAVAKGNDNGRSFRCFCTYILTSLFSSFGTIY